MRTTLEIDDDLLITAKQLARERGETLGHIISDLARKSLTPATSPIVRNGVHVFERRPGGPKVDLHFVNKLRDEE
jgi:hypothetical protein